MFPNITNNLVVVFHPGAEDKRPLGSVPMVLSFYVVNLSASVPCLVYIFQTFCPLLCLCRPCRHPLSLQSQYSILPPSLGHLLSWFFSASSHRSNIVWVVIYWDVFFLQKSTWFSTSSRTSPVATSTNGGYSHVSVFFVPLFHPCQTAGYPVVEKPQGSSDTVGCNPHLWAK